MTDTTNASLRPAPTLSVETIDAMKRRGMAAFSLTLADARQLTPHMRRLSLAVHGDDAFEPKPGQDMVFMLPDDTGELNRRHYSVRGFDRAAHRRRCGAARRFDARHTLGAGFQGRRRRDSVRAAWP
ncbi:hypothetical protein [Phenylobacterium sp.]|uniref:hypothetical protein n=1 Tax=Phenylobacterium sp. TaxID=1871053 RepID=UPI002736D58B|nr:hypothetical protein [Phenylobacterium sp.]MDP3659836.1 hypothetical protein [Phenylobacterium sp.]